MGYAGDITPEQSWKLLNENPDAVLVDCRTDAEWRFVGVPDLSGLSREDRSRVETVIRRAIDRSCTVGRTLQQSASVELTVSSRVAEDSAARDAATPSAGATLPVSDAAVRA